MIKLKLNNLKLRTQMMLSIGSVVMLALAVTITFVSVKTSRMTEVEAMDKARETAFRYGSLIDSELEIAMNTTRAFSATMEGMIKHRDSINREAVSDILKQILQSNDMYKGIWCVFEPNMLDGRDAEFINTQYHDSTGMYYPYFYKDGGSILFDACNQYSNDDYYQIPKKSGMESIIDPYIDVDSGNVLMTTVCVPIRENGKVIGVAGIDIDLRKLQGLVSKIRFYETGYLSIISNNHQYVSHPDVEKLGKSIIQTDKWAVPFVKAIQTGKGFTTENFSATLGENAKRICVAIQVGQAPTPWAIMSTIPAKKVTESARSIIYTAIVIGAVSLLALMAVIFFITRSITSPLLKGVHFAQEMSEGNFTQKLSLNQKDEVGTLTGALDRTVSKLGNILKNVQGGVDTLSTSSLTLSEISQEMADNAGETSNKSDGVNKAAREMDENMSSVATASEQALTNLNIVAASMAEMTTTITEIERNTESASGITGNAVKQAQHASECVDELGHAAREIGSVTEVITEISEQTNLLALNATIEAARAGEAGKGFAVVASEIKDLAGQTSEATSEIKKEIEKIQGAISTTVGEIKLISDVNNEVNNIVSGITTAVEEQSATTREVSEHIAQASQGFEEVHLNVSRSADVSQEISKDISEINYAAGEMSNNSSQVKSNAEQLLQLATQLGNTVKMFRV